MGRDRTPRVSQEYRFTERDKVKYPEELSFRILEISRQSFAGKILIKRIVLSDTEKYNSKIVKSGKIGVKTADN